MEMEVLAILMVAFGLFAILMFILFYAYAKRYNNEKHLIDDYQVDINNEEIDLVDIMINNEKYTFDSNNYDLYLNQNVKVILDDQVYDGVVIKENYTDIRNNHKVMPPSLILKELEEEYQDTNQENEEDSYPNVEEDNYGDEVESNEETDYSDSKEENPTDVSLPQEEMEDFIPKKKNTM